MSKLQGLEVKVIDPKVMAIKTMVVAMGRVMGRPVVGLMQWMPVSNRGI